MPKPIVVIFLPRTTDMYKANEANKSLKRNRLTDEYHVLCATSNLEHIDIKVFYEKDFNEVKYEELKKIIQDSF